MRINWKRVRRFLGVQEPNTLSPAAMERAIDRAVKQIQEQEKAETELALKRQK